MRLTARRTPLATVTILALGLAGLLLIAPHARAYNPVFKGPVVGISDGLDWGTGKDDSGHQVRPGDKITATLRIGNGIPGQAGYRISPLSGKRPRRPLFVAGATRALDFSGPRNSHDDGSVTVRLPFAFPFGGLRERTASVSTNGWISFGSPAWDSWERASKDDRGAAAVVGDFERGIMPYWADLEDDEGGGGVKMVTTAGDRSVAFQWEASQDGGGPRRNFQLVLFRDGRFRFDYPDHDKPGGKAFIGYSLGSGGDGYHPIAADTRSVLAKSVLVSPRSVKGAKTLPAGRAVLDLPGESAPSVPPCSQEVVELIGDIEQIGFIPTACPIPALKPGEEAARTVSFKAPGAKRIAKKEVSAPAALGYSAAYLAGRQVIGADDDEVSLSASHRHGYSGPNWISVLPTYSGRSESGQRLESGAPPRGRPMGGIRRRHHRPRRQGAQRRGHGEGAVDGGQLPDHGLRRPLQRAVRRKRDHLQLGRRRRRLCLADRANEAARIGRRLAADGPVHGHLPRPRSELGDDQLTAGRLRSLSVRAPAWAG